MIQLILIVILGLLAQLVLPWWSVAIVAFLVCLWRSQNAGQAFTYSFYGCCSCMDGLRVTHLRAGWRRLHWSNGRVTL